MKRVTGLTFSPVPSERRDPVLRPLSNPNSFKPSWIRFRVRRYMRDLAESVESVCLLPFGDLAPLSAPVNT